MQLTLKVNGTSYDVDVDAQKTLLWVLREDVGLTGTKYGCGIGICGSCTVLVDGVATRSCMLTAEAVGSSAVTTIEGLTDDLGTLLKEAWVTHKVSQCGYCQPGQIVSAYGLLSQNPDPAAAEIENAMTSICRCGTYQRIRSAITAATEALQQTKRR